MKILTHFHHVHTPGDFDQRLQVWLAEKFSKWADTEGFVVNVYVMTSAPRRETHGATYECHMTVTAPWIHKTVIAKEAHTDFWTMLYSCVHKARRQIQKIASANRSRRRRWKGENRIAV